MNIKRTQAKVSGNSASPRVPNARSACAPQHGAGGGRRRPSRATTRRATPGNTRPQTSSHASRATPARRRVPCVPCTCAREAAVSDAPQSFGGAGAGRPATTRRATPGITRPNVLACEPSDSSAPPGSLRALYLRARGRGMRRTAVARRRRRRRPAMPMQATTRRANTRPRCPRMPAERLQRAAGFLACLVLARARPR